MKEITAIIYEIEGKRGKWEMEKSTMIICRCEEVTLENIKHTAETYQCSAREVKLRTRAGMGYCGGRTCRTAIDAVLKEVKGNGIAHDLPLKVQPPVRPVSLSALGGEIES